MIPWAQLIPHAFSVAEMAGRILSSNKKEKAKTENNHSFDPESLLARIEILENNEIKQAELIQQMAQQNLTLIKKAESNYRLAIVGTCIGAFSIVLSLLFILLNLK
ncbi:hypothetical protein QRD02_05185 [Aequorivita sp. SDUM287046]|uniref:Uncharacterized protein n=1 Tax=Aequorivita aurantiaca TaxID=3053356 RepID=A0ABT8DEN0_9FLAO|nr:hypothetical protein [Aequorivita aurantiaca]MDN3723766.1 hypothetical protein [Aequorivita aurantiaca]